MTTSPIILVPGFWLGAWAWDEVAALLRADGHDVTAVTLPGLESVETDRSGVTLEDHVAAICAAVEAAEGPVVLAVHSGAGAPGYAASDRLPERIKAMVYVDSGPATGALDPGFDGVEMPLPEWADLDENLDGISEEKLAEWRERAVPQPGGAIRETVPLTDERRLDVPTTVLCTSFPSSAIKEAVQEGYAWVGGLTELRDVTWVDEPTSHWPMWSKPKELAALLAETARS
ncbi:MAG TPA: alpha/beta hydrolase [Nocardioidaceae bacterium]|nr:alpha/beta hydrolase [Nocardioidaceae bacterium]